jgi:hypothetical protein
MMAEDLADRIAAGEGKSLSYGLGQLYETITARPHVRLAAVLSHELAVEDPEEK